MKWIFFGFVLLAVGVIIRYLPFGFGITVRQTTWDIRMPVSSLLLAIGSSIILVQAIGDIIRMIASARHAVGYMR